MKGFLTRNKIEVIFFSVTVIIRLVGLFAIVTLSQINGFDFPVVGEDSRGYLSLAQEIIEDGTFGEREMVLSSYRTPGYPLFLAAILFFTRSIYFIPVIQAVLTGLAVVLILRIGRLFLTERSSRIAAMLFVIDPVGIFYSGAILTEQLYVFLLVLAIYLFLNFKEFLFKGAFWGGLIFGLSVLTRPSGQILLPLIMCELFFIAAPRKYKKTFLTILIFLVGYFMIVFPWMLRNKIVHNSWELSVVASTTFFKNHVRAFYAEVNNVTIGDAEKELKSRLLEINPYKNDLDYLENAPYFWQVSRDVIKENPLGYAKFHLFKSIPFFLSDGLREIARMMKLIEGLPSLTDIFLERGLGGLRILLLNNKIQLTLLVLGFGFWSIINLGMFAGAFYAIKEKPNWWHLILFIIISVLILGMLTGSTSNPRYRFGVSPFMYLGGLFGLDALRHRLRQFLARRHVLS